jgi:hypothetical protein
MLGITIASNDFFFLEVVVVPSISFKKQIVHDTTTQYLDIKAPNYKFVIG